MFRRRRPGRKGSCIPLIAGAAGILLTLCLPQYIVIGILAAVLIAVCVIRC